MSALVVSVEDLPSCVGREFGPSAAVVLDQARIDSFAAATQDHQWIHVDVERAAAGPFGSTIAHGFLTLSLLGGWLVELLRIEGARNVLNYGLDKVRFLAPVPAGGSVAARFQVTGVQDKGAGSLVRVVATVGQGEQEVPVCVAELLVLVQPAGHQAED